MIKIFSKDIIQKTLLYWLLTLISLALYIEFSHLWVPLGVGEDKFTRQLFYFEIPLILLVSSILFFPRLDNRWIGYLLPVALMIFLYSLFDAFYKFFGRAPTPTDFDNLSGIFEFSMVMGIELILTLSLFPLAICLLVFLAAKRFGPGELGKSLLLRCAYLGLIALILNSATFSDYHGQNYHYVSWSQEVSIRINGKFSSFIYFARQEKQNQHKLKYFSSDESSLNLTQTLYPGRITAQKNFHLIVLESFVDPRLLTDKNHHPLNLSRSILASELLPYLTGQKDFSHVISPVYGGHTAQAEFELLTGVPALAKVNRIEFNVLRGAPMTSLLSQLQSSNYQTMATIASGKGYFNSEQAYESLGFDQVTYLQDSDEFAAEYARGPLFDGNLLQHNLTQLKSLLATQQKPLFNYVLGMYGHIPFARDKERRPDVVDPWHSDDRINRITNQFYYRTRALANYLQQLLQLDPHSLIYVTSDHLPSVLSEEALYQLDNKRNIALLLNDGINLDVSGKKYYELPWLFWDLLRGQTIERKIQPEVMENYYFQLLAQSITAR